MKASIHPQYYSEAKVICSCGNTFTVGSTEQTIHIELCNKCHPFYTGEERFVDSASQIQRFEQKRQFAKKYKEERGIKKELKKQKDLGPKTLKEMLMEVK